MSDLLSEAMEMARNHRTSSLDPSVHPTGIVRPDVCESCGDALTKEDIAFHSVPNPATELSTPHRKRQRRLSMENNLEMDAGAGAIDYSHSLIFTSSKFVITAFGHDREHCEDVLQCVLLGRFQDHEGDREHRAEPPSSADAHQPADSVGEMTQYHPKYQPPSSADGLVKQAKELAVRAARGCYTGSPREKENA